ncbi:hypothetical protein IRJ41_007867 [Triplophysa rosa]|uniref:Uncharacterized protein n=1 Tax=Triplophysa rosa TaxID=992332 RepID=A0A9W7W946_TRIRA|nr:hypothetical protein IRJ41_007867 [Triplophysa rosa]
MLLFKATFHCISSEPVYTPAEVTPKRAAGPAGSARTSHATVQSNDPVLSALSSIKSSLSDMNTRIQALEAGSRIRHPANPRFYGPSTLHFTSAKVLQLLDPEQDDDVIPAAVPRRTMGSAVPVSTGSPFFSPAAVISHQLRSQILAADISLVTKLFPARFVALTLTLPICAQNLCSCNLSLAQVPSLANLR